MSPVEPDPLPRTAADVMTAAPRTCSPFSTVLEAVLIFRDAGCGAVPVVEGGKPVGVVTDRDVALALADRPDLVSRPLGEIMTGPVVSVTPDTPLDVLRDRFGSEGVRRLLVVDANGGLAGIIAWSDLAPALPDRELGRVVTEVVERP